MIDETQIQKEEIKEKNPWINSQKTVEEENTDKKVEKVDELRKSDFESKESKPNKNKVVGFMDNLESSFNEESEEER